MKFLLIYVIGVVNRTGQVYDINKVYPVNHDLHQTILIQKIDNTLKKKERISDRFQEKICIFLWEVVDLLTQLVQGFFF